MTPLFFSRKCVSYLQRGPGGATLRVFSVHFFNGLEPCMPSK